MTRKTTVILIALGAYAGWRLTHVIADWILREDHL